MKLSVRVVLAVGLWQVTLPAEAQVDGFRCELFFAAQRNIPPLVLQYMQHYSDASAEGCTTPSGELLFYRSVTEVSAGSWSVCRFSKYPRVADGKEMAPTIGVSAEYMALIQSACPRQDDPRYIRTEGVSDGLFAGLSHFVATISSSESEFDAGFALKEQSSEQDKMIYGLMRDEILRGPARFEIKEITLAQSIYVPSVQAYQVTLFERPFCGSYWALLVDLTPMGLKAVAFEGGRFTSHFQAELARVFRTSLNGVIIHEEVFDGEAHTLQQRVQAGSGSSFGFGSEVSRSTRA